MAYRWLASFALVIGRASLEAQSGAIPVRDLGAFTKFEGVTFTAVLGVKEFANGSVLVDDAGRRRLLVFDSTLAHFSVWSDTGPAAKFPYGNRPAPILQYAGDSILFVDWGTQSLLVIAADGGTRAAAVPKVADLRWLTGSAAGTDAHGRLLYRSVRNVRTVVTRNGDEKTEAVFAPDSSPIIRADFVTRAIDTVALVKIAASPVRYKMFSPSNELTLREVERPLQTIDEWTITSDGVIAIVRGSDYHVDWIGADGNSTSTPKMPFDWKRLVDADKQRIIDSLRARNDSLIVVGRAGYSPEEAVNFGGTAKLTTAPNGTRYFPVDLRFAPLAEMPDYYPPLRLGSVKADADGNIWILPTTSAQSRRGGLVYDVVNRKGELFERVEIPPGRTIAGFGRRGVVYLMSGDRTDGYVLERAHVGS